MQVKGSERPTDLYTFDIVTMPSRPILGGGGDGGAQDAAFAGDPAFGKLTMDMPGTFTLAFDLGVAVRAPPPRPPRPPRCVRL